MRRHEFLKRWLAIGLALGLAQAPAMSAQEKAGPKANAPAEAAAKLDESEAAKALAAKSENSPGGPHEGIKVHGHWTIVIRNADGSVASRHDFENAFVTTANTTTAQIFGRQLSVGLWQVLLGFTPASSLEFNEPTSLLSGSANVNNLQISVDSAGLHLSGSGKAPTNATGITLVNTRMGICYPQTAPASPCADTSPQAAFIVFTSKDLIPGIPVQPNQTVDVSVLISFS